MFPSQFSRFSRPSSSIIQFILTKNSSFKFGKYSISTSSTSFSIAERLKLQKELSTKPKEEQQLKQLNDFVEIENKILAMDILKQFKLIIKLSKDLEDKMVIRLIKNLRGIDVSSFCPLRLEDAKLFVGTIDKLLASLPNEYPDTPKIIHTAFESTTPPMFSKNVYEPQIIQTNLRVLEARFVDSRITGHLIVEFKSVETVGENKLEKFEFTFTALPWLRKQMTYFLHKHGAGEFNQLKIPEWLKQKSLE
uniref:Uncharacterized protein n=1 Tax=Meloidogyne incognita TaxID=6306 RepID=A0A914NHA3_MELIC